MKNKLLLTWLLIVSASGVFADQTSRYFSIVVGSVHFGGEDLNDFNPGLTLGLRRTTEDSNVEYHVEGGVYYNSYEEVSPILVAGISNRLFDLESVEVRGSLSFGTAYYGELAPTLKDDYGIPNIDGFIPIIVAGLSFRHQTGAYRFSILPGEDLIGAINFSVAFSF